MNALSARLGFWRDHRWAPDRMSAYLDGELPARPARRMEEHLTECVECRRLIAGLRLVVAALHLLPGPEGASDPARLAVAVRGRLQRIRRRRGELNRRAPWRVKRGMNMRNPTQNETAHAVQKSDREWREALTPDQYEVLRHRATERPFTGKYVHEKREGRTVAPAAAPSCSPRRRSSTPGPAGRASPSRRTGPTSSCMTIPATACTGSR